VGTAAVLAVPGTYATIQAAVTAAAPGDTIDVAAGVYAENVIVTTPVLIRGAGAAATIIRPSFSAPNPGGGSLPPGHSTVFLIQANNVTIENLTVDGDNPGLTSGIVAGGADIDARNGIITNHPLGLYNGLTVRFVTVKNIFLRGIYASSGGTFHFHDCRVQNVQADPGGASIGIFNFGGSGIIERDTVSDCSDAISANHSKGTQFLDNIVTNSGSGVHTDNAGDAGGTADLIQGNTVSNSTLYGYGIWVFVPYIAPIVQNNTVTNVDVGMGTFGGAFSGPTANVVFTNNTVDGQNKPGSVGFYATNTTFFYGVTSIAATLTNMAVTNNVWGMFLESAQGTTLNLAASGSLIAGNTTLGADSGAVPIAYGGTGLPGTMTVNLSGNWWGSATGPNNALHNPSGTGNGIEDGLDYSPWWGADYRAAAHPWNWHLNPSNASTIAEAVAAASAADTLNLAAALFPLAATTPVNKADLMVRGAGTSSTIVQVPQSAGYGFSITAAGVTLRNMQVQKTDVTGVHNLIYIGANNVTIEDNLIYGPDPGTPWSVNGIVSRAMEVAGGLTGLMIRNNTIHTLRQPAYINPGTVGTVQNNLTGGTRGWVNDGANIAFTGNTWGPAPNQGADIALLASTPPAWYPDLIALSLANTDAYLSAQFAGGENGRAIAYVDDSALPGGDGSPALPYQTIAEGATGVLTGGVVDIAAGTYTANVTITKRATYRGAGSGSTPATNTVVTPPAGNAFTITAGGASAILRTVFETMYVSAPGGDGFDLQGSASYITFTDVASVGNLGNGIGVNGTGDVADIAVMNCTLSGNGNTGFRIATAVNSFTGLTITGGTIANNVVNGLSTGASGSENVTDITVNGTVFTANGNAVGPGGAGSGDLSFFKFNGNATLSNLTLTGAGANTGIQLRGADVLAPMGTVVLSNVQITGQYQHPATWVGSALFVANYSSVAGLSLSNVTLNATPVSPTKPVINLYLDNVPAPLALGATVLGGGAAADILNISTGAVDATAAVFTGAADHFAIEDRVVHAIDLGAPTGLVTWVPNNVYVTLNSFALPTTSTPEIQRGVDAASAGWTVNVGPGTFLNDVTVTKALTLLGRGASLTTIMGLKTGANSATVRIATTGATVEGFTITRDGNNTTDWATNVKLIGLAIQGTAGNATVRNNTFTGNRSAIDINFSSGNLITLNVIDFNRSGLIFRNQCTGNTISQNVISNNWTVGVLWLAASTEDATGTTFFNNRIEGNWYAEIENRSLTGGVKNFSGNWLGGTALTTAATNGAEPGYTALIPVAYGGTAVPPGGALSVRGAGLADMDYTPWLEVNTDVSADPGFQGDFTTLRVDAASAQAGIAGRIQEAVNLVSGSTIYVLPGTYREQVYINESMSIIGTAGSDSTFIVPPVALMSQPFLPARSERPIVGIDSLGTNVILDGFTIDGEGAGNTQAFMTGVQYFKGSGVLRNSTVKRIRTTPFDGTQAFVGVLVNHDYPRAYAHAVGLEYDSVYDCGKANVVFNHPGTVGSVLQSVILGQGPTPLNAQNGIQFGFGATGSVSGSTVGGFSYTGASWAASSILGVGSDGTLSLLNNTVLNGQVGINLQQYSPYPTGSCNATVTGNTITASAAGTGTPDLFGIITWSEGGPSPMRAAGRKHPVPSPVGEEDITVGLPWARELATMSVAITGNTLDGGGSGAGIYALALGTSPQTVTGDSNRIAGYASGVVTDKDAGATLATTWRRNRFAGNAYGMADVTGVLQDARENWWNDGTGPRDVKSLPAVPDYNNPGGLGDSVTAFVDYNPWYLDSTFTALSAYTLTVSTVGNGSVTRTPDLPVYLHGTLVTLAAVPDSGFAFLGWSGDTTATADTITVVMDGAKTYTATFTFGLTVTVAGSGTVVKTPDQPTGYASGTWVGLKAVPTPGWDFVSWSGDTTATGDSLAVQVNGNRNIIATFQADLYPLTVTVAGSGFVTKVPNQALYLYGDLVTLTATPGGSYSFAGWSGDTVTTDNPIQITIDGPTAVTATFVGDKFLSLTPESLIVKDPISGKFRKPARIGRDPYPNWSNLLHETVVQGGFQPDASESDEAGGMIVGVSHMVEVRPGKYRVNRDSARVMAWVRLSKWNSIRNVGKNAISIQRTLEDRTGVHDGRPRGLDILTLTNSPTLKLLRGEKVLLPPKRHDNMLFAEMVALKFNIAASQLAKTPSGFGELLFNQPGHAFHGLSVAEIAEATDEAMTYWQGRPFAEFDSIYSAVSRINRAFAAPLDTVTWAGPGQLVVNGLISVGTIPFLQAPPVPPVVLRRTSEERESEEDFDDGYFEDESGSPVAARLLQNYPNPFNPTTTIAFALREPSLVTVRVYDMLGREVGTLLSGEELEAGEQTLEFSAGGLASGTYFYRIDALAEGEEGLRTVETRKMLLIR
jgi:hypothetical protein